MVVEVKVAAGHEHTHKILAAVSKVGDKIVNTSISTEYIALSVLLTAQN